MAANAKLSARGSWARRGDVMGIATVAQRFAIKPVLRLIDVCIALATSPRKFARANIALGDQRSFMRGLGLFVNLTEWAYWFGARNST